MPSLFSRMRGKDGKTRSNKHGNIDSLAHLLPTKPQWDDAYTRTSIEPEEVQDLIHRCTAELKSRALDLPFLLLPFRPTSDPSGVRTFIRHFFDDRYNLQGEALAQELRLTEPMVISGVLKWCWSRIPGGLVGWDAYELFKVGEHDSSLARDSFATFIPLSIENQARSQIVFDYFDLISAIAAHGKTNGFGGLKLSRMAAWWAFEHRDTGSGFEGGYRNWLSAADATAHLFFAYLRSLSPQHPKSAGISLLPRSLQKLLEDTDYPPKTPTLLCLSTYRVVMIVDSVSPTPFALLRRANHFQYRNDDKALQNFSEYEDPVTALTEECRRVLKAISLANQSQISSSKHSTSLRDASWSRFEDIGFGASLEEEDEDEDTVKISRVPYKPQGLRTTAASGGVLGGRPTTPSWADFLSSGFVDDSGSSNMLLPPDKVLPPIDTNIRQRSSQSHRPRFETERLLEPGELASITRFDLDDSFWWVWMSSLAPEETAERKSAFGRCAVIETIIESGRWLVMEEMIKGAAPEPDSGAYIAEKKGLFSWTRRGKGMSRSKSTSKGTFDRERGDRERLNPSSTVGSNLSKTSFGPDQQAKIQAAAQQLSARQQQQRIDPLPERRGRAEADMGDKTNSVLTLQPVIMKEASPAMKWANKYDKEVVREAYLGNFNAGRGQDHPSPPSETNISQRDTNGSMTNMNGYKPDAPEKSRSSLPAELQSSIVPTLQEPAREEPAREESAKDESAKEEAANGEPAKEEAPAVPEKNFEDVHPAQRPDSVGRNSPLPPLPRKEESISTSPEGRKNKKLHKEEKKSGGFRKLFGRKNRQSKLPDNAAADVNALLAAERTPSPLPNPTLSQPSANASVHETTTVPTEDEKTPTQLSALAGAPKPTYDPATEGDVSRVNTADQNEAHDEFSRFDQGPLMEQPAFAPPDLESDYEDDEPSPPMVRRTGEEPEKTSRGAAASPIIESQDRWAAIRRNAAERAARQNERPSEEQSRGAYSKTTDGEDETSGEETIESRVARIKARVAELTGNMEGTGSPVTPPAISRR